MILDLGTTRELFVDSYLLDRLDGVAFRLHQPHRDGLAVAFDEPWEGAYTCYATVIKDADRYLMYYRGWPSLTDAYEGAVTCVAESDDGLSWTKPKLGLFEVLGSSANNVILDEPLLAVNFSPFLDTCPGAPASQRFKALAGSGNIGGSMAFVSADGIVWRKLQDQLVLPKSVQGWDSQNVAFWSEHEQCYLAYIRTFKSVGQTDYRWISRATSDDFVHWSDPVEMDCGDTPAEHFYTNATQPYFRAPHIYIALPKRFLPDKPALDPDRAATLVDHPTQCVASSDSVFMTSRGGTRYDRTCMEAFIRPGPSERDWVARENTPALGVVPAATDPRQMYLYRIAHAAQPSIHMARYSLRVDGFISMNAPYRGGELITKPFRFSGTKLTLNYVTSAAGGMRVELQDADGRPIDGHSLADCPEFIGDDIERSVRWRGGSDVGALAGRAVRLRFAMKDADLYSLRFV